MRIARLIGCLAGACLIGGCVSDLESLRKEESASDAGQAGPDLVGADLIVPVPTFMDVSNDMTKLGCPACHTGAIPMPITYAGVSAEAMNGEMSLLLTKTLKGSGTTHGGPQPFASADDPTYRSWLAWANAGAPQ
jgi:hypothetical protein